MNSLNTLGSISLSVPVANAHIMIIIYVISSYLDTLKLSPNKGTKLVKTDVDTNLTKSKNIKTILWNMKFLK